MADTYSREQIKFIQLTQAQYDGLNADPVIPVKGIDAIDPHTIYFTTDTHKIYKGSKQFSNFTANEIKLGAYASSTTAGISATDSISQALQRLDHTLSTVTGGDEGIAALSGRVTTLQKVTDGIGGTDEPATVIAAIEQSIGALDAAEIGRSSTSAISSLTVQGALQELADAIADSTAAQKTYYMSSLSSTSVSSLGANVRQAYQLFEDGAAIGDVIKIYKDSSLHKVYIGYNDDEINSSTGDVTTVGGATAKQSLNFVYLLADGTYQLVAFDVSELLTESEFDSNQGLKVVGGVVSVKLGDSNQYVKIDDQTGAIVDNGINDAIAEAKGQAISSANAYTDTASSALSTYVDSSVTDAFSWYVLND